MKADEAPEKLYLHPTAKGNVGASWLTFPLTNEDIEYIRKDAFINKVANYLNYVLNDRVEIKTLGTMIPSLLTKGEFVEDFKKYMEE
jgi:hypothetical protein